MTEMLPKWLQRRYLTLRHSFGTDKFSFKEAQETLGDDSRVVNLCLSDLRKHGWLTSEKDPKDSRKKLYRLADLNKTYDKITKEVLNYKREDDKI